MTDLAASTLKATVEIEVYEKSDSREASMGRTFVRRTVEVTLREQFNDNEGLIAAADALARTIKQAVER